VHSKYVYSHDLVTSKPIKGKKLKFFFHNEFAIGTLRGKQYLVLFPREKDIYEIVDSIEMHYVFETDNKQLLEYSKLPILPGQAKGTHWLMQHLNSL